ncbi:MAG: hypothetical protein WDW36_000634 [Sanguina aurantia]
MRCARGLARIVPPPTLPCGTRVCRCASPPSPATKPDSPVSRLPMPCTHPPPIQACPCPPWRGALLPACVLAPARLATPGRSNTVVNGGVTHERTHQQPRAPPRKRFPHASHPHSRQRMAPRSGRQQRRPAPPTARPPRSRS